MERFYIDCRDYAGDINCSVALSADTKEELLEAVVQHGGKVHGYQDTPEFRENIVKEFKKETVPAWNEFIPKKERIGIRQKSGLE